MHESVVELNEDLYIIGGTHEGNRLDGWPCKYGCVAVWSPLANSLRFAPPIKVPRLMAGVVACLGRIYLFGGLDQLFCGDPIASCEMFNPETEKWAMIPSMPKPVHQMYVHANGPKIFLFGGAERTKGDAESVDFVQVFDTRTKKWSRLSPMPDYLYLGASVQVADTVYFLGGYRSRYEGKDLVAADVAVEDCCICMEKLDGAVYDPPGRECNGCNTQHAVKMKCPCGLARYCNKACQALHRPAHKKACKEAMKAIKAGNHPVAKMVCGHAVHLHCFHEHCDHTKMSAVQQVSTGVPCPLCRHNVDQSAFFDNRSKDTESQYVSTTVSSTWSYNMTSGIWTVLADAPFEHDDFFVLEPSGKGQIVSVSRAGNSEYPGLTYSIATNTWETKSSIPTKPWAHGGSSTLVEMLLP